jgi:hypothetical protein
VQTEFDRVHDALSDHYLDAAEYLDAVHDELLAFAAYPRELWPTLSASFPAAFP